MRQRFDDLQEEMASTILGAIKAELQIRTALATLDKGADESKVKQYMAERGDKDDDLVRVLARELQERARAKVAQKGSRLQEYLAKTLDGTPPPVRTGRKRKEQPKDVA